MFLDTTHMSAGDSDQFLLKGERNSLASFAEPLLESISDVIVSVLRIAIEQESFIELGCYLYRVSSVIMELQISENVPENVSEVLQLLSVKIGLAKNLVGICQNGSMSILNPGMGEMIKQLDGIIKCIGEDLTLIPLSAYGDQEYAKIALQSLIKEMRSSMFDVSSSVQTPENKDHGLYMLKPVEQQHIPEPTETKSDVNSVDVEISIENSTSSDMSYLQLSEFHGSIQKREERFFGSRSVEFSSTYRSVTQYVEPLYETFFCPLTKEVMDDPVTIESGVTYEREAISEWFTRFSNAEEIVCPNTGQKVLSRVLNTNVALKATIEEWRERNEAARIKVARAALALGSSDKMVLEALKDLQSICRKSQYKKIRTFKLEMIPLLAKFLDCKERNVRCTTLELLRELAENDDEAKKMIADATDMEKIIKMFSSSNQLVRNSSLLLLLELSRSQGLISMIGLVKGGILMLITLKYRQSHESTSKIANEILKNLESSLDNIKCMAKNGYWDPLLDNLVQGSEEIKTEMASCLSDIVFSSDEKTYIAEKASPILIKMVQSGNSMSRDAAFQALRQISVHHTNSKILIEAGIMNIMFEEMFTRKIYNEPMNSKEEAAAVLANILESGLVQENLQVNTHGHTMTSDYIVYNIIDYLKSSTTDELNVKLLRILLCLMKSPKSSATVVSVIKETEARYRLMEFINNPNEELGIVTIRLLISLSPYMGHTLADTLCKTQGLPESLIQTPYEASRLTEKQALSVMFLGKLPHQNLLLNLALLNKNTVFTVQHNINLVQRIGLRTSKHASAYLEGLVSILVRFTATLYDHQILLLAKSHNFTSLFTELLVKTSSDEVQRLSAVALENLSSQSINLSRKPKVKTPKYMKLFFIGKYLSLKSRKSDSISLCAIHRGVCSSQETFCLLDANAVERLLNCLDHENPEVIEAALSALCTLLDDKVDVVNSVSLLTKMQAPRYVLNVVKDHKEGKLWEKSLWMIEQFFMKGRENSVSEIVQDRVFPATLINVLQHGDGCTRQMAENILRHMDKIPDFSTTFTM